MFVVQAPAVCPGEGQFLSQDEGVDLDQVAAPGPPVLTGAWVFWRWFPQTAWLETAVQLSQVVEADRCRRQVRVRAGHRVAGAQVAQQTVAEAVAWHPPKLLADLAQGTGRGGAEDDVEEHGVHGGEPADRAGDIEVRRDIVATVPCEATRPPPFIHRVDQRQYGACQQYLIDARTEGRRCVAQQRPGPLAIQAHPYRRRVGARVERFEALIPGLQQIER